MEQPSSLLWVVSLQQYDGSWTLKDAAELTGMPFDALSTSNPAKVCGYYIVKRSVILTVSGAVKGTTNNPQRPVHMGHEDSVCGYYLDKREVT